MTSILLIGSVQQAAVELKQVLEQFSFNVEVETGHRLLRSNLRSQPHDLILIELDSLSIGSDLNREGSMDTRNDHVYGIDLIREIRAAKVRAPIIVRSALDGSLYEAASLDAGADDYVPSSISSSLLLCRLHAHLRRSERDLGMMREMQRRIAIGGCTLDREARILCLNEVSIHLTRREMKLLEQLGSSPTRVFTPEEILDEVWGDSLRRSGPALSGLLRRLRLKASQRGIPDPVENVRSRGFRLAAAIRDVGRVHTASN